MEDLKGKVIESFDYSEGEVSNTYTLNFTDGSSLFWAGGTRPQSTHLKVNKKYKVEFIEDTFIYIGCCNIGGNPYLAFKSVSNNNICIFDQYKQNQFIESM